MADQIYVWETQLQACGLATGPLLLAPLYGFEQTGITLPPTSKALWSPCFFTGREDPGGTRAWVWQWALTLLYQGRIWVADSSSALYATHELSGHSSSLSFLACKNGADFCI